MSLLKASSYLASEGIYGIIQNNLPFKPIYASPEVIKGHNSSEKSDVYSFGMIMYGIVTRLIPFNEIQKKKF